MISLEKIYDAQRVLKGVARVTPLMSAPKIGSGVYIKAENLQLTGSFKLRGAFYKINNLSEEEKEKGVIACSAGNHAQGVALSASKSGVKSIICIPSTAPLSKIEATRNYGAEVILVQGVYDDAYAKAVELAEKEGYTFAHPFNDEDVIAGQGTIGLEILSQLPEVDVIIAPIGGGGLIGGISFVVKSLKPTCKIIGVQAEGAPSMYVSRKENGIKELKSVSTIADGIAIKKPGDLTFDLNQKYVDEIVTVSDEEIAMAIVALMETQKTVAEGAGATSVAAVMSKKVDVEGKNAVCVISGGNIDLNILSAVITKGLSKTGRITEITTKVLDRPGQLIHLLQVVADEGANLIRVNHYREDDKSEISSCVVKMSLETKNRKHAEEIKNALIKNGYEII